MSGALNDSPEPTLSTFEQLSANDVEAQLRRNEKGNVQPSLYNARLLLQRHPEWVGVLAYDEFAGRVMKLRDGPHGVRAGEWLDIDDIHATLWMSERYAIEPKRPVLVDAVQAAAEANRFHEVRQYLQSLRWDGQPRVMSRHGWLHTYLGADESRYTWLAGVKWLVSAVARVSLNREVKADCVLVLEGAQGLGKSTALRTLFHPWFTDAPLRLGDREAAMVIRGRWGVELGELDALNKAESTTAKNWFSATTDRYRSPWGRRPEDVRRQCVFAGTTNESIYFKDATGNRRYWPILVRSIARRQLEIDRDQLWAEAVELFQEGCPWHVDGDEVALFDAEQQKRTIRDAFQERIESWLEDKRTSNPAATVTMAEILGGALGLDTGKWSRSEQTRVGQVVSRIENWHHVQKWVDGRAQWVYEHRKPAADAAASASEVPL